jgi:hypothetical protein
MTVYYRSPQGASDTLDPTSTVRAPSAPTLSSRPLTFAQIPHEATGLSLRAYQVLGICHGPLGGFMKNRNTIDLADAVIARRARCTIATVQRALRELEERGWIKRDRRNGHRRIRRLFSLAAAHVHAMITRDASTDHRCASRAAPPGTPPCEGVNKTTSSSQAKRDDVDVAAHAPEGAQTAVVATVAELPGIRTEASAELPTALETAELPAGALEAIARAEVNPELGAAVAAEIRADAGRIDREIDGNWPWFAIALCVVIVRDLAAKRGKARRVEKPVRYAIATVRKYADVGGIGQEDRDAVAEVKRRAAAKRAELAREVAAPRAVEPEPPPSLENVPWANTPAMRRAIEQERRKAGGGSP